MVGVSKDKSARSTWYFKSFALTAVGIALTSTILLNERSFSLAPTTTVARSEYVCLDIQLSRKTHDRYTPTLDEISKCLIYEKPSAYIDLLMKVLVGTPLEGSCTLRVPNCKAIVPYKHEDRQYGLDWPPFGYTMAGIARVENFRAAILEVNRNSIPGSIMELGVWRGGAMIMAAGVCKDAGVARDLYVIDAFEAIPGYGGSTSFLENSMADVQSYFDFFGLNDDKVHFVKGLFKDSLPAFGKENNNRPIAVLRVDGNFYDSYSDALYNLYESVPIGGIVIFDDVMSHPPVQRFWSDFQADQEISESLNRIDEHSAWFRKTKAVKLDHSKRHAPQDVNK
jgi:hypothetical protein